MSKEKMKSKASVFAIRMQLLWIWFLKNITVFLRLSVIVIVILILFGVIKIGDDGIIDAIFGDVINTWSEATQSGFKTFENVIAAILSLGISVLMVMRKTNSITIKDIKSRKLKIAMLKANLYFNEHGKLCKKLEETTKMDLDGDGKAGDTDLNEIPQEITAVGVVRAAGELAAILTTPIDPDYDGNKVVEGEELSENVSDTSDISVDEKLYTEIEGAPESVEEEVTSETEESDVDDEYDMDKELDKPFFLVRIFKDFLKALRLTKDPKKERQHKEKTKKHKHKEKAETEESAESVTSVEIVSENTDQSMFAEEPKLEEQKPTEEKPVEQTVETPVANVQPAPVKKVEPVTPQSKKSKQIDDILNSLK